MHSCCTRLILLLGLAFLLVGSDVNAQRTEPSKRIGVLLFGSEAKGRYLEAMREGLRRRGYSEANNTVSFKYRYAHGHLDRLRPLAIELVLGRFG